MGLHFSRIWERMFGKREMRILMVGLDAAGKVNEYISNYDHNNNGLIIIYLAHLYLFVS